MRHYRNYSDEDIREKTKEVKSIAGLLTALGLVPKGGNYAQIKNKLKSLNIDTSHWTGRAWNKDQRLKDWSEYSRNAQIKPHLIKERGHICEWCGLEKWREEKITLELDHIDGDKTNNSFENLRLLCPNCHSQTPTWRKQINLR